MRITKLLAAFAGAGQVVTGLVGPVTPAAAEECDIDWWGLTRNQAGACTNQDIVEAWVGTYAYAHAGPGDVTVSVPTVAGAQANADGTGFVDAHGPIGIGWVNVQRSETGHSVVVYPEVAVVGAIHDADSVYVIGAGIGGWVVEGETSDVGTEACGFVIAGGACVQKTANSCVITLITLTGIVTQPCPVNP